MPVITLEKLEVFSSEVQDLFALSNAYMAARYPAESNHMDNGAVLAEAGALALGVRVDGTLAGCGAVRLKRDGEGRYGEIKRVFVAEGYRGLGLAHRVMDGLEAYLREQAIALARLETGVRQPEALGLYGKRGYRMRGAFGGYAIDPLSVFMEKTL
ncbi:MAG TPA: GNAT family N-acetyltransferase [Burkholderiaceae bacterium]